MCDNWIDLPFLLPSHIHTHTHGEQRRWKVKNTKIESKSEKILKWGNFSEMEKLRIIDERERGRGPLSTCAVHNRIHRSWFRFFPSPPPFSLPPHPFASPFGIRDDDAKASLLGFLATRFPLRMYIILIKISQNLRMWKQDRTVSLVYFFTHSTYVYPTTTTAAAAPYHT